MIYLTSKPDLSRMVTAVALIKLFFYVLERFACFEICFISRSPTTMLPYTKPLESLECFPLVVETGIHLKVSTFKCLLYNSKKALRGSVDDSSQA